MRSLRGRLLLWLLGLLTGVGVLAGLGAYVLDRNEVDGSLDAQLRQIALNIGDTRSPASGNGGGVSLDPEDALVVTIWDRLGQRRTSDSSVVIPRQTEPGFATLQGSGEAWRSYALVEADRTVQVAQREVVREEFAANSAWRAVLPILVLLPLLWLLVGWTVGRGLRPLHGLTAELRGWGTASTDPLPIADVPDEVLPLVLAMNELIARLHAQLEFRQQFISDAAHELRTPLTALRLQVNNLRATSDERARKLVVDEMERGLRRTSDMIAQMLDLARAEAAPNDVRLGPIDLQEAIASSLQDVIQLANEKRIDVGLNASVAAAVRGDPAEVRTLLKNLLDNAVRYSPAGSSVDITLERSGDQIVVEVCDTGPGIPTGLLDRVFDRFFRVLGADVEGSGLGLPIVRAIADRCGASVTLRNRIDPSGLVARVSFHEAREDRVARSQDLGARLAATGAVLVASGEKSDNAGFAGS